MITIISPFGAVEVEISDLTTNERNALAQLLGVTEARKEAFETLRHVEIFKKIKQDDVWRLCPKYGRFKTEFSLEFINNTPDGRALVKEFKDLIPDAQVSAANHTVSGFCKRCNKVHSITKTAVMVKTSVHNIPFSNLYGVGGA